MILPISIVRHWLGEEYAPLCVRSEVVNYRTYQKRGIVIHPRSFTRLTLDANGQIAQKDHPGHGPQYLWNASVGGKTKARNLPLGPELEKVEKEVERYREFNRLCQELVEINDKICHLRPVPVIQDENELEQLKKKLNRHFARKRRKR